MNKNESKYFNTAKKMDEAFIELLHSKDYELITIKEICEKAKVNRSTFYLHYDNITDLLQECVDNLNHSFANKYSQKKKKIDTKNQNLTELILISNEYLIPYLQFVKENKNIYKIIRNYPILFNVDNTYQKMFDGIFSPILERFGIESKDAPYYMEYYIKGITSIVIKWAGEDCKEDEEKIANIIINCVLPNEKKYM